MNLLPLCFIFIILIQILFTLCSLLSRFKNRYEYISHFNNVDTYTEDLYDFEFTNNFRKTSKISLNKLYLKYNPNHEEILDKIAHKNPNNTERLYEFKESVLWSTSELFQDRPTVNTLLTTISKLRKTWPTYFPRQTLPSLLENIKASVTKPQDAMSFFPWIYSRQRNQKNESSSSVSSTIEPTRTSILVANLTTSSVSSLHASNKTISTKKIVKMRSVKSWCYRCGLNETKIPMPYCHNTFTGRDQRLNWRKKRFKVKCIRSPQAKQINNIFFGPWFRGGCFKRFLDVGTEYNERGSRTVPPLKGKSFASTRFAKLETLLKKVEDGCVYSPHASITPFSRAISLYARYHVCVCSQKYCNHGNSIIRYTSFIFTAEVLLSYAILLAK